MLDADKRELRCGAERVTVEPQVLDLLIYLLQNHNRVVSKDDLIASVWGGRIVSDGTLISRTYAARKAIGDTGQEQRLIRTIPRKGLRFVGEVRTRANDAEDIAGYVGGGTKHPASFIGFGTADHRRSSFHQYERRSGARIFFRWHQRRHHRGAVPMRWFCRSSRATRHSPTRAKRRPEAGRRATSAPTMCSRAACARPATVCASPRSSSMFRPAATSGPSATIAELRTSSRCRTRSPRPSLPRSNRSSTPRRVSTLTASRRTTWEPGSWSCGRCRISGE